jgi:hypothetical protein
MCQKLAIVDFRGVATIIVTINFASLSRVSRFNVGGT